MKISGRGLLTCVLPIGAAFFASALAIAAAAPTAPVPPALAAHKALYAITMISAQPGGAYVDVNGTMYFSFTDSCDAWLTNQKFILHTFGADGQGGRSDSDYSSSEDKTGDNYSFSVRKTQDGEVEEFRGRAKRNPGGGGVAEYVKPERATYKLPPHFLFPTAQTVKLIEHAQKGDHFFNAEMFDGTEGGGAGQFNAVVLKTAVAPAGSVLKSPLLNAPAHRVRIAFYPTDGAPSNQGQDGQAAADTGGQPDYEQTMTLHDNGVISDMDVDLGDYSVHYRLQAIEPMPRPHC